MKFIKLKSFFLVSILLSMATGAFAQDTGVQLQRIQQQGLVDVLRNNSRNNSIATVDGGMPSAIVSPIQNTKSLKPSVNVVAEPNLSNGRKPSVIEDYFKILTGSDLDVYGSNEFGQDQDTSLLFFNTFGSKYRLAPGDVLKINLRGFLEADEIQKVTRNGTVILPSLPPIDVVGITTDDVERKILELLRLGDASASIYVSLDTGRLVTVQISGGVQSPRTVAIPAYTPLSRFLSYVGGVSNSGSLRNINLISNDGVSQRVDFYDFLQNPLGGSDPLITDSARVYVGDIGATVAVSGFVARTGIFELPLGQNKTTVKSLMKLSATSLLPPGAILELLYFDQNGLASSRPITLDDEINAGEALNVSFVNTRNTNIISVRGSVVNEYDFSSVKAQPLTEILKGGAVLKREAELSLGIVHGPDVEPYIIDVQEALNSGDTIIQSNSTVYILSKAEYQNFIESGGSQLKNLDENKKVPVSVQAKTSSYPEFASKEPIDLDQDAALDSLLLAKKVNIFLDGKLHVMLAPNTRAIGEPKLASLATGFDVYPLYIGFNRYDETTRAWSYLQLKAADLFDIKLNVIFRKNDQLNFYSTDFINQLGSEILSKEDALELDETVDLADGSAQMVIKEAFSSTDQGVNALLKSARNVFGAVDRPGAYPIAGAATLSEILSVAGGTVDGADLSELKIVKYKIENGRLLAGKESQIDIENQDPANVLLEGQYTVMIPFLINDASSGTISVNGEVLQPGDYIFSRAETLQEIIEKAGGLSKTAYPLGVVLSREAVREKQREANRLLASEVEASILKLSQSDVSNSKDQVQAILGFAERLRNQEVVGRLTVNVLVSDPSAPIFLEDGDKVFVPKRPSYVSIIGSVQKETMASYSTNKSFPDYIAAAGGLNGGADKKRIYVILPNGESLRATQDVVIPPGAVVVVPPKTDKLSILGLTDIISRVMGNIATSVLAINNVN